MAFQKKKTRFLLFVAGIVILSITGPRCSNARATLPIYPRCQKWLLRAEKCRRMVGEMASSQSGKFSFLDCFDGSTGTLVCAMKEGVKLYANNISSTHVELARHKAVETALVNAVSQGQTAKDAAQRAQKEGKKAANLVARKADRIIGPFVYCAWDFMESIYYEGTMTEGFLRGTGTLIGTYAVGFLGEQRFGRFGYLLGSQLGSWVGGSIGLMVNDLVNGVYYVLKLTETAGSIFSGSPSDLD